MGYGFVRFVASEAAAEAMKRLNGAIIRNKRLKVSYARRPSNEIKGCKIRVSNVPNEISDKVLRELFDQFGDIIEFRLVTKHIEGISKVTVFIQFNVKREAERALMMNKFLFPGMLQPIDVEIVDNLKEIGSSLSRRPHKSAKRSMNHSVNPKALDKSSQCMQAPSRALSSPCVQEQQLQPIFWPSIPLSGPTFAVNPCFFANLHYQQNFLHYAVPCEAYATLLYPTIQPIFPVPRNCQFSCAYSIDPTTL